MLYTTFIRLCDEALNHDDCQEFIMTLGWQSWMDATTDEEITKDLSLIFELAGLKFKELRARMKLSMARMSVQYQIPLRTIESWESEKSSSSRSATPYLEDLLRFTVYIREKEGDDGYLCNLE